MVILLALGSIYLAVANFARLNDLQNLGLLNMGQALGLLRESYALMAMNVFVLGVIVLILALHLFRLKGTVQELQRAK